METFRVGCDVSAKTMDVAYRTEKGGVRIEQFDNDRNGHRALTRFLKRRHRGQIRVVMESTGIYGLDLAIALDRAGIEVMVANPRAAANFAKAVLQRSKTDRLDAEMLLLFCEKMNFIPWKAPAPEALELRSITRRVQALLETIRAEKSRLHAAMHVEGTEVVRKSIRATIKALDREIRSLRAAALTIVKSDPTLSRCNELLLSVKGIGQISALSILAELAMLPKDMSNRQWVAHAGLDPREFESGTSVKAPARISKRGNSYLRAVLYLPARVAKRWEPNAAAFSARLAKRGKKPLQIHVAIMRKLLHGIHAMFANGEMFDSARLFPATAGAAET